jgi:hypothetical protein
MMTAIYIEETDVHQIVMMIETNTTTKTIEIDLSQEKGDNSKYSHGENINLSKNSQDTFKK